MLAGIGGALGSALGSAFDDASTTSTTSLQQSLQQQYNTMLWNGTQASWYVDPYVPNKPKRFIDELRHEIDNWNNKTLEGF